MQVFSWLILSWLVPNPFTLKGSSRYSKIIEWYELGGTKLCPTFHHHFVMNVLVQGRHIESNLIVDYYLSAFIQFAFFSATNDNPNKRIFFNTTHTKPCDLFLDFVLDDYGLSLFCLPYFVYLILFTLFCLLYIPYQSSLSYKILIMCMLLLNTRSVWRL